MKGYRNFDAKEAYKACLRAAEYDTIGINVRIWYCLISCLNKIL